MKLNVPSKTLQKLLNVLSSEASVEKAFLFGSRARGDNKEYSDIDIAVMGDSIPIRLKTRLTEAAGLYAIDIVYLSDDLEVH